MTPTFVHTVHFPPLTDIKEMVGMYINLFDALGLKHQHDIGALVTQFQHPIPEENAKLVRDYFNTQVILSSKLQQTSLTLLEIRIVRNTVVFLFSS